jgi:4'-phosphopantetheinyl transferase
MPAKAAFARTMSTFPALSISERDIDLWLVFYDDIEDERLLADMRALLNDAEREQQGRFHFADDRKRYLVTRALVRSVLSHYAAVDPGAWAFSNNDHGRPFIRDPHPDAQGLRFNVSHTRGLVALAVGRHRELGVDVENIVARKISLDIAGRFFSPREAADVAGTPDARRHDRLFEYWTLKESYVKARGMGLSLPLDKFAFHFPHARAIRIDIDPALGDHADRWSFWQYRPRAAYLLALCAQKTAGLPTVITTRRIVPTAGYDTCASVVEKTSDA